MGRKRKKNMLNLDIRHVGKAKCEQRRYSRLRKDALKKLENEHAAQLKKEQNVLQRLKDEHSALLKTMNNIIATPTSPIVKPANRPSAPQKQKRSGHQPSKRLHVYDNEKQ